ncbi:MAG TPA: glycosyltransferase family 39 protein [Nocardioides sp.]
MVEPVATRWHLPEWSRRSWPLTAILVAAALLRLVKIGAVGFNSDEAVYAGQAAALGGNPAYTDFFPVFRAHPMLVQTLLSVPFRHGEHDVSGRVLIALMGVATVALTYAIGRDLYGRRVGLLAAAVLAVMPYHVIVSRQLLLDVPMVLFTSVSLYCLVRFAATGRLAWALASGAGLGLAMLSKESAIVMCGAIYAFLALTPSVRRPMLGGLLAFGTALAMFAGHPVSVALAGGRSSAKAYLVWQLVRSPNHGFGFYAAVVPKAVGPAVVLLVLVAVVMVRARREPAWREVLLVCWVLVPAVVFTLWPVKGYQYLLAGAPALAVLAAYGAVVGAEWAGGLRLPEWVASWVATRDRAHRLAFAAVTGALLLSLSTPSVVAVLFAERSSGLAGTGGVPGGRETGAWVAAHTPAGSTFLTVGPSMANLVQYYGHRKAYGLSVSPNPLHRNPSYEPIPNPDLALRQGTMQYVVWDTWSARRSTHFSAQTLLLARRYHGRVVHTEYAAGKPAIVVYEVRP